MHNYPLPHFQSFILPHTNYQEQKDFIQKQLALSQFREKQLRTQLQNLYLLFQTSYMPQPIMAPFQFIPQTYIQLKSQSQSYQVHSRSVPIKVEEDSMKYEENPTSNSSANEEDKYMTSIRIQVTNMLYFFLNEFGKNTQEDLIQERLKFSHDKELLQLFDSLIQKYSSTVKSKEEFSRFVLRKAIAHLRDRLRARLNCNTKAASVAFCKKYFKPNVKKIVQGDKKRGCVNDNEKILSFLLPYKKNSRNKTPNSCFIKEIFSSEIFCRDYSKYVEKFEEILEKDNEKKITRFIDFLMMCVKERTVSLVSGYKRLPWLKCWLQNAKNVAEEILLANQVEKKPRQLKGILTKEQIILKKEES